MNREDFPILKQNLIYFDNGATTMKPQCVIDSMVDYYSNYTANAHRGDYDNSMKVDVLYEGVRGKVRKLIDAKDASEVVFTKGTTESLNLLVFGFMKGHLNMGDELLLTKSEHASNVLPWMELAKEKGIVIKYIPLDDENKVTIDNVLKTVSPKTKVISLAQVTNVIGDVRPMKEIGKLCQERGIYFVVDGAQSVPHMKVSVQEMNADFLAFSGHKMLGPTGVGVLWGKMKYLQEIKPFCYGGGMNASFESTGDFELREVPTIFDAGTPAIAEVIGLGTAIDYLEAIGLDKIQAHEQELKRYLLEQLKNVPKITVYNPTSEAAIVAFNIDGVFSQDTAIYLNHYHICVRAGNHCAKILKDELKVKNTCRISFYLYNTKEEIDELIRVLKDAEHIFDVVL